MSEMSKAMTEMITLKPWLKLKHIVRYILFLTTNQNKGKGWIYQFSQFSHEGCYANFASIM